MTNSVKNVVNNKIAIWNDVFRYPQNVLLIPKIMIPK